ncbi:MAG: pirin-like C-terminal cupin domain-containing protein, partial [Thermodesulfobacteriota bacterium]
YTDKQPFAHETKGKNYCDFNADPRASNGTLILFEDGKTVHIETEEGQIRFLLISGKPIGEPIAWYGPIVMNTQEELRIAFEEYRQGTFLKHKTI